MDPNLLIDENLRGLARWLRFLGFDTKIAEPRSKDSDLLGVAVREKRILFTRDRALSTLGDNTRLVSSLNTRSQLTEVLKSLQIPARNAWFSRCTLCNRLLREISPTERDPTVPAGFACYWYCDACGRTYWQGSHFERTKRFLEGVCPLGGAGERSANSKLAVLATEEGHKGQLHTSGRDRGM